MILLCKTEHDVWDAGALNEGVALEDLRSMDRHISAVKVDLYDRQMESAWPSTKKMII